MTRKWGEHPNDGMGLHRISKMLKGENESRTSKQVGAQRYSGAEIHRGLSIDNHKHLRELQYVLASDYESLRQRFEQACARVFELEGTAHETRAVNEQCQCVNDCECHQYQDRAAVEKSE